MRNFAAVIERDPDTGLFVGFVPGFPGAHSQGATLEELNANLREVISMLLEDGEPVLESEFVLVRATDAAGHLSAYSAIATVTTTPLSDATPR
jgi:predicted RNase H-like HicB family nuclease